MIHRIIHPTLSNMITATDIVKDKMYLDGILHRLRYKEPYLMPELYDRRASSMHTEG